MKRTCVGGGAAIVALAMFSGTAAAASTACVGADTLPTRANVVQVRAAVTCLVNEQRVRHGLAALRTVSTLRASATMHSADMVRRGYFSHVTPTGVDVRARLSRAGVHSKTVGENIAWGMGDGSTPLEIVSGWMHSPPHRANILSRRFTTTGVGVAIGAPGLAGTDETATFTQVFAGR